MATHTGCFARIEELEAMVEFAIETLEKLGPKWLYWPSKRQVEGQPTAYESRNIQEVEDMAQEAVNRLKCFSGLEDD